MHAHSYISDWFDSTRLEVEGFIDWFLIVLCVYIKNQSEAKFVDAIEQFDISLFLAQEKKCTKLTINLRDSRSKIILATPHTMRKKSILALTDWVWHINYYS